MKNIIIVLLTALLLVGCGSNVGSIDGLSESQMAMLNEMGISEKEFNAMSKEKQEAILLEVGAVSNSNKQETTKKTTLDDVRNGGNYVVTVGDSMLWNYFELHYQDGKLVKIVTSFQKNDEQSADVETFEGENVKECTIFFIDYTDDVNSVVNALKDKGYTYVYIEKV